MRVQTAKKQRYKILLLFSLPTNRIVEIPLYGFLVQLKYVVISIRSKVRILFIKDVIDSIFIA